MMLQSSFAPAKFAETISHEVRTVVGGSSRLSSPASGIRIFSLIWKREPPLHLQLEQICQLILVSPIARSLSDKERLQYGVMLKHLWRAGNGLRGLWEEGSQCACRRK
ncbi:hypothetical protein KC363_g94 [Hortaea werneckii]|nr:hypothetical protein KC363_g94 [Hortaea werneckii]